jgi:hypothetical protein
MLARGTFAVNIIPQAPEDKTQGLTLGRILIEKQFQGDVEAAGKGQMFIIAEGKHSYEFAYTLSEETRT